MNAHHFMQSLDALSVRWMLTLLHFLWQGLAIGGLAAAAMAMLRKSPQTRYAVLLAALAAMTACPAITFYLIEGQGMPQMEVSDAVVATNTTVPMVAQPVAVAAEATLPPDASPVEALAAEQVHRTNWWLSNPRPNRGNRLPACGWDPPVCEWRRCFRARTWPAWPAS